MGRTEPSSAMGRVPIAACLVAFVPVLLTRTVFRGSALIATPLSVAVQAYPLGGFVVYVASVWLAIGLGWGYLRREGVAWRDLGFVGLGFRDLGWAGLAGLAGLALAFPGSQLLADWLGLPAMRGIEYRLGNPVDLSIALLVCVLIGPLGEEILYRGFLVSLLQTKVRSPWLAGLFATVIFALVHVPGFGLRGALYILFWTPLPVALFIWRHSIHPPYLTHVLNNAFAYLLLPLLRAH